MPTFLQFVLVAFLDYSGAPMGAKWALVEKDDQCEQGKVGRWAGLRTASKGTTEMSASRARVIVQCEGICLAHS